MEGGQIIRSRTQKSRQSEPEMSDPRFRPTLSSKLSDSVVSKFRNEFEKSGLFQFTWALENRLKIIVNEAEKEHKLRNKYSSSAVKTKNVGVNTTAVGSDESSEILRSKEGGSRAKKPRVIGPNDIVVNTGLKKIRLESDWVEPKVEVKTEEGLGEGGAGNGDNAIEVEEDAAVRKNKMKGKRVLRNRK